MLPSTATLHHLRVLLLGEDGPRLMRLREWLECGGVGGGSQSGADHIAPRGHEVILLVEDERAVRGVLSAVLRGSGYTVLQADGGPAAVHQFAASTDPIQLLVTDVVMPGMSGSELVAHLRQRKPDLRVLYVSGYADDAVVHHGILDGGVDVLTKPVSPRDLAHKVREVLDRRGGTTERGSPERQGKAGSVPDQGVSPGA